MPTSEWPAAVSPASYRIGLIQGEHRFAEKPARHRRHTPESNQAPIENMNSVHSSIVRRGGSRATRERAAATAPHQASARLRDARAAGEGFPPLGVHEPGRSGLAGDRVRKGKGSDALRTIQLARLFGRGQPGKGNVAPFGHSARPRRPAVALSKISGRPRPPSRRFGTREDAPTPRRAGGPGWPLRAAARCARGRSA